MPDVIQNTATKTFSPLQETSFIEADDHLTQDLKNIPNKMAFRIGEVAKMLDVKPYVLRYWETEFKMLNPQKSRHNQRAYSRKNVELLFMIKKLLYKDRFSIEGARAVLSKMRRETKKAIHIQGAAHQVDELQTKVQNLILVIQDFYLSLNEPKP